MQSTQADRSTRGGLLPPTASRALFRDELGWTFKIGGPLALGELGWMSTYIVDAIMIGRLPHSALPIAASSLGNTIYYAIAFFVIYLMNGLETFISQAYGRGDKRECTKMLAQSFWIVLVGTPLTMALTMGALHLLPFFHTPADIVAEAHRYLSALIWSTFPLLLYMALRRYLQSINRVALISISLLTAAVVNWAGDWAFLYGHLGLHPMGVAGSGWSTCVVRWWMLALLLVGTASAFRSEGQRLSLDLLRPDWARLKALLKIGWPSGLEYSTELGCSTCLSILAANFGATLLAAQQVALDLNAFVYMIPSGLSYAAMIRVGQAAGRSDDVQVRRAANANLVVALGLIGVVSIFFAAFAHTWAGLYTNDPNVVLASIPIFHICAVLQLGDAAFVIFTSSLTGLGDTRTPLKVSLVANWLIGMSLAYVLAFPFGYGLRGLWIGRLVGSLTAALALAVYWQYRMRRTAENPEAQRVSIFNPMPGQLSS